MHFKYLMFVHDLSMPAANVDLRTGIQWIFLPSKDRIAIARLQDCSTKYAHAVILIVVGMLSYYTTCCSTSEKQIA